MKHTKGPWELVIRSESDGIWGYIGAKENRDTFARVDCCNEEKTANAVLMAAAPEMLEALCSIYYMANLETLLKTKYSVPTVQMIMQQMADAIASARGR